MGSNIRGSWDFIKRLLRSSNTWEASQTINGDLDVTGSVSAGGTGVTGASANSGNAIHEFYQAADSKGIRVYGHDDEVDKYTELSVRPDGSGAFTANGTYLYFYANGSLAAFFAGTGASSGIYSNFNPNSDNTRDLGALSLRWAQFYSRNITDNGARVWFGGTQAESITDASTTAAAATLTKAGENFQTTCSAGDLVIVTDSTTAADEGIYRIISVDSDTQLTVDRAFAGTNTDVDFLVIADAHMAVDGDRIYQMGAIAHDHESITAANTGTAASLGVETTYVTTNGDEDLDNVTLADGYLGLKKTIVCETEGHANDTWKITPATMVGGSQITFAGAGEGCTLVWSASGWIVSGNNGGTIS